MLEEAPEVYLLVPPMERRALMTDVLGGQRCSSEVASCAGDAERPQRRRALRGAKNETRKPVSPTVRFWRRAQKGKDDESQSRQDSANRGVVGCSWCRQDSRISGSYRGGEQGNGRNQGVKRHISSGRRVRCTSEEEGPRPPMRRRTSSCCDEEVSRPNLLSSDPGWTAATLLIFQAGPSGSRKRV